MVAGVTILLSEFFGAVSDLAQLVPQFSERQKKDIKKETEKFSELEARFHKAAIEFNIHSRSDELLGLADQMKHQEAKVKNLHIIFAKELRS